MKTKYRLVVIHMYVERERRTHMLNTHTTPALSLALLLYVTVTQ